MFHRTELSPLDAENCVDRICRAIYRNRISVGIRQCVGSSGDLDRVERLVGVEAVSPEITESQSLVRVSNVQQKPRNPLASARGYTELVSESVSEPEATHLQTALEVLDRMETLIGETLALAPKGVT